MKKLSFILLCAGLLTSTFSSCEKTSDPNPEKKTEPGTNTNTPSWNWTGKAPFSAKLNGKPFEPADSVEIVEAIGYINIMVFDKDSTYSFGLSIPADAKAGSEYNMPSPANVSYTSQQEAKQYMAAPGKYKITSISATQIEGYFYADLKAMQTNDPTIVLTEGYFKVNRK